MAIARQLIPMQNEPAHDKNHKKDQRRLRLTWASAQSDQRLR